jgi:20S proteasome alpha/beta subunit
MTIIVGITTPDGVILASDSRTTREDERAHRIISDSAQKVFEIERFGVATTGLAFIAGNTIAGLMDQCLAQLDDTESMTVGDFADALGLFFDMRFRSWADDEAVDWVTDSAGFPLSFLVAGYDAEGIGHIHEVKIPGPVRGDYSPNTTITGTMWRGQTDVITRMLKGIDRSEFRLPVEDLSDEAASKLIAGFDALEYRHLFPVTAQDAIDYSSFLIRTTIDMQRFSDGTLANPGLIPGCGGPLQILVVERNRTHWASKPPLGAA